MRQLAFSGCLQYRLGPTALLWITLWAILPPPQGQVLWTHGRRATGTAEMGGGRWESQGELSKHGRALPLPGCWVRHGVREGYLRGRERATGRWGGGASSPC